MTGTEWRDFASALHEDTPLRRWLMARIKKDGRSDADVKVIAEKVATVADIMAIPESERTPAQTAQLEALRKDPTVVKYADEAANRFTALDRDAPQTAVDREIASGSTYASTNARADELSNFGSAPKASEHYEIALKATTPLDTPRTAPAAPIVKPAPSTVLQSGFDV